MGPMSRGRKINRRKVGKGTAVTLVGLMVWSLIAAPEVPANHPELEEPFDLSAYTTSADSAPIRSTLGHNTRLVELTPAIAHSKSEVSLPSQASSISWLADLGIANSLYGTTTGTRVLTESTASQPGGAKEEEFKINDLVLGSQETAFVKTGRSYASADHGDRPRGYGNAYLGNICIGRRPGSPPDGPGTFDPDALFPGAADPIPDPGSQGQVQQCVLSIGSAASTSESLREQSIVKSVAVSEVNGINIGLRTADGSCRGAVSCINIDFIRAETFVEADATAGGSRARWRVTLGRACRRSFSGTLGVETDTCVPFRPEFAGGLGFDRESGGGFSLTKISQFEQLNKEFEENQVWQSLPGLEDTMITLTLHAGTTDSGMPDKDPEGRCERTDRNWAYPDTRLKDPTKPNLGQINPDYDAGQVACATAEGLSVDLTVINFGPSDKDLSDNEAYQAVDADDEEPGLQLTIPEPLNSALEDIPIDDPNQPNEPDPQNFNAKCAVKELKSRLPSQIAEHIPDAIDTGLPGGTVDVPKCPVGPQTVSTDTVRAVRRVRIQLGTAASAAIARPGFGYPIGGEEGTIPTFPEITIPTVDIPTINIPEFPAGGGGTTIIQGGGGIGAGPLKLKIDWASVSLKPWPAEDMAKGILSGGMIGLAGWLLRRRLGIG